MKKFSKKEPVAIDMPLRLEKVTGESYVTYIHGTVLPNQQTHVHAITMDDGKIITMEELLGRMMLTYPGDSVYDLEKYIRESMIDCAEVDYG